MGFCAYGAACLKDKRRNDTADPWREVRKSENTRALTIMIIKLIGSYILSVPQGHSSDIYTIVNEQISTAVIKAEI
ncbi:MAG: hypothetical protein QW279_07320 [Candidatus Jordarchaeaceae archaeon]